MHDGTPTPESDSSHRPLLTHKAYLRFLALCALGTVILGTWGFLQYDKAEPGGPFYTNAFYHSVQLFALHSEHFVRRVPWELELGRWLGAISTILAVVEFSRRALREEWTAWQMGQLSRHVIVCGLGQKGLAVITRLRRQKRAVVVIEKAPQPDMAEACRNLGALVLTGDATNAEVLHEARIQQAESLVAICPGDSTNCEIAAKACAVFDKKSKSPRRWKPLQCRVQVSDLEARTALQNLLAQNLPDSGAHIHFFDSFDPEARELLTNALPLDHAGVKPDEKRQVHLIILGFGRMGRALAVRAAQLGVFAAPRQLKISVIDRHANRHRQALLFHHPYFEEVCDIEFHQLEALSLDTRKLLAGWFASRDTITSVAVCFDEEQIALGVVLQLRQLVPAGEVRVAVRMSGQNGLAGLMKARREQAGAAAQFHAFGTEIHGLADDAGEQFARAIHAAYLKLRESLAGPGFAALQKVSADGATRDWDVLTEDLRESNRQQADHIYIKLRALGLEVANEKDSRPAVTEFTPAQIEILAEMEHRRWVAERRIANWTLVPTRNDQRRENLSLIPWDKLTEEVKDYDRHTVRMIPKLLAGAGKKILQQSNQHESSPLPTRHPAFMVT